MRCPAGCLPKACATPGEPDRSFCSVNIIWASSRWKPVMCVGRSRDRRRLFRSGCRLCQADWKPARLEDRSILTARVSIMLFVPFVSTKMKLKCNYISSFPFSIIIMTIIVERTHTIARKGNYSIVADGVTSKTFRFKPENIWRKYAISCQRIRTVQVRL